VKVFQAQALNVLMEQPMDQLKEIVQDIMEDCKEGRVAVCDHVTSLFKVICVDVHRIHLMRGYESLHPGTIFNRVEVDMGCSFK
jgi:hypothetical protein